MKHLFCNVAISVVLLTLNQPSLAASTANQVQQLYANYFEGTERWVCFHHHDTNHVVAFYQWSKPEQGDNKLTLVVHAQDHSLLGSCTISAFEPLRNAAFELGIVPPRIKLIHYVTNRIGNVVSGSRTVYQCTVPAQQRDHRTDVQYDTAYDLGSFQNLCR
ncbi:hypothetical protein ACN4EK_14845 [Pantanalinema rosaneae CENA516]|uniref:hypothetical protein n=1 Tax=Pantanalinema rosaneae TaxID=1620701 RepID=UPI003D6F343D